MKSLVSLLILACLPVFVAHADDAESETSPHWEITRVNLSIDTSDAGNDIDVTAILYKLETFGAPDGALLLSCQIYDDGTDVRMNAAFITDLSRRDAPRNRTLRNLTASGYLAIGDARRKAERWIYNPHSARMVPFDRVVPKRLFNAAVRGDTITLQSSVIDGRKLVLQPPPMDDAFREFARVCPLTNGSR